MTTELETAAAEVGVSLRVHTETAPVGDLIENDWNPNEMDDWTFQKVIQSIKLFGWVDPPTCVRRADGAIVILDGAHRVRAAKFLGLAVVTVNVIGTEAEISPSQQRQLTLLLNELKGRHDPGKTAILIEQIEDLALEEEIVVLLPYPETQVGDLRTQFGSDGPSAYPNEFDEPSRLRHDSSGTRTRRDNEATEGWSELVFRLPESAALVVRQALDAARDDGAGDEDWQCLEAMAAEYIAGHVNTETAADDEPE